MWSASELRVYHDSLAPFETATANALGNVMTLRLYHRLPVSQRQETMDQVSRAVSDVFGYQPPAPVVIDESRRQVSWYAQGLIVLDSAALGDVRTAIHTALHESFHCFQKKSVDQWRRGEIGATEPRAAIVPVWAYNFQHYIQPTTPQKREVYIRQPLEFHAERFAHRVLAQLDWLAAAEPVTGPVAGGPVRQKPDDDLYDQMYT